MRKLTSFATAAAVIISAVGIGATPAEARGRHGGWGYPHRDRVSAGEVVGGLLILGTIAMIADAASKDRQARDRDYRYVPPYPDQSYPDTDRQGGPDYQPRPNANGAPYGASEGEARAADACSWAAEGALGDDARVDNISATEPRNGGWHVSGTVSRGDGAASTFECSYRGGRVVDIRVD